VVLGGPMSADDEATSPWMVAEKAFVSEAVESLCCVLGVCLGAQILAEVTGGHVRRNDYREIGWYPIRRTEAATTDPIFATFPSVLKVGHWHGDTFELPEGIPSMAASDATRNQAFTLKGGRVVGIQFHLEWTADDLDKLVDACPEDVSSSDTYVMMAPDLVAGAVDRIPACRGALFQMLDLMRFYASQRE
jgi:GMP synthase-like glutamine amidotransferase